MLPKSQMDLATTIVASWKRSRSNYIVVCPPMCGEREIITKLTSPDFIYSVVGDLKDSMAIAKLDTADFSSEAKFAAAVARKWRVEEEVSREKDPSVVLELACQAVTECNRMPIIVIQRFHEALDKLGEDIGTTLRNLEHSHRLKTVVTMPVSLQTLRERWGAMNKNEAPFLASDWGQGHTNKLLKGYAVEELINLGKQFGLDSDQCAQLHSATGGSAELIDSLVEEVGNKKNVGLEKFLQSRSVDLCHRMVRWLDAKGVTHVYKKNIVNLMCAELYGDSVGQMRLHDWHGVILNNQGELNFYMLAWAAKNELMRISGHTWLDDLTLLIANRKFANAQEILEISGSTDQENSGYWKCVTEIVQLCELFTDVYSSDADWSEALALLNAIKVRIVTIPGGREWLKYVDLWNPIASFLSSFLAAKRNDPLVRVENYLCTDALTIAEQLVPFLQLLDLRLNLADSFSSFHSLHTILTIPETLLQLYAFSSLAIKFWDFDGVPSGMSRSLSDIAGKPYELRTKVLGYSDLAHLILLYALEDGVCTSLVANVEELKVVLEMYEVRKDLAHSTTFVNDTTYIEYRDFCKGLLARFVSSQALSYQSLNIQQLYDIPRRLLDMAPK